LFFEFLGFSDSKTSYNYNRVKRKVQRLRERAESSMQQKEQGEKAKNQKRKGEKGCSE